MKTIEERADAYVEYLLKDAPKSHNENLSEDLKTCCKYSYINGAKHEREILTRWNDPKENIPPKDINSGVSYLLKIVDEDGDILYRVGARIPNSNKFVYPSSTRVATVIGWREIHE